MIGHSSRRRLLKSVNNNFTTRFSPLLHLLKMQDRTSSDSVLISIWLYVLAPIENKATRGANSSPITANLIIISRDNNPWWDVFLAREKRPIVGNTSFNANYRQFRIIARRKSDQLRDIYSPLSLPFATHGVVRPVQARNRRSPSRIRGGGRGGNRRPTGRLT